MRSGLCNCLAVYDWNGDISGARFHEIVKPLFDANGVLPDVGSVAMSDSENDLQKYSRLAAALPTSRCNVNFYHTLPGYKQLAFGWDISASLDISRGKTMVMCFAQNLANLGIVFFEEVVRTLAAEIDLKYGIGYQRPFELGPDMYAYGLVSGLKYSPKDMAEGDRIGAWMRERLNANRHLEGYLRDVYPLNILSAHHIARNVGNLSLAQWIEQTSDRGHLAQVGRETWLWTLPGSQLYRVQADLRQAEYIIVPPAFSAAQ